MTATYVAIIMDGNGRWAQQHGVPVAEGHKAGADTVKARLRDAADLGVRELTIYSFSTENWSRPQDEVDALMALFSARIIGETPELHEEGVKMRFLGRREGVVPELIEQMEWAEAKTAENTRITLYVAFNYGGRSEILDAAVEVHRRRRGGVPQAALRARDARSGPADPDQRGAADLQLPALAGGLQRAALHRRAVARLLARGLRRGAGELRGARAPLRGSLMAPARPARRSREREPRARGTSDLLARVVVAVPAAAFAAVIIWQGEWVFAAGIALLGVICVHELSVMFHRARPVRLAAMAGVLGLTVAGTVGDERTVLMVFMATLPVTFFLAVAMPQRERVTASISVTVLMIFWIGLGVAHAALLRGLDHGGALVLMVLLGTFFGDTFAYFGGRLLGRHKMSPVISPNKTWEGLACGIVLGTLVVWYTSQHLPRQLDLRHRRPPARPRGRDRRADR